MLFTKSLYELVHMRYSCFLLECRKDEEREANFPNKEVSSPILETMASFSNGTTSMEI